MFSTLLLINEVTEINLLLLVQTKILNNANKCRQIYSITGLLAVATVLVTYREKKESILSLIYKVLPKSLGNFISEYELDGCGEQYAS